MPSRQPPPISAGLEKRHPTHITVGKREVILTRQPSSRFGKNARTSTPAHRSDVAIAAADDKFHIVEYHCFGLTLVKQRIWTASPMYLKDFPQLAPYKLCSVMNHRHGVNLDDWCVLRPNFHSLPLDAKKLQETPYRSLACERRRAGGITKHATPFSGFLLADFLRRRVPVRLVIDAFNNGMVKLHHVVGSHDARYLPGGYGCIAGG